jgi:hypothetical protein
MRYRVVVPPEPSKTIPRGAAVLETGERGGPDRCQYGLVFVGQAQFGELCAQAARGGRRVVLPADCREVGYYDAIDGELRTHNPGTAALERWIGRRVGRSDLEALDNRTARRRRARRLLGQGRYAEAARIDPRMGL